MTSLAQLQPQPLWTVFEKLSETPRPSGHEEQALQLLEKRLNDAGVKNWRDTAGNLMMSKPATAGKEGAKTVVLQSHIDMVPQKATGVSHDFTTDPLKLVINDGWLSAEGTTLGADNGIGVAAIMAVMESSNLVHGPLEGLITIDEERGLVGAQKLERNKLKADILLNLDSEDEGELFIGCAGGSDFDATFKYERNEPPKGVHYFDLSIDGLTGGHSGIDIHRGRANAIQILARFMSVQMERSKVAMSTFDGGTLPNAIPRDAKVLLAVPTRFYEELVKAFEKFKAEIEAQYRKTDPKLNLTLTEADEVPTKLMKPDFAKRLLMAIRSCPSQATRMSAEAVGVSETSNNLAVITTSREEVKISCMARSLIRGAQDDLVASISDLFVLSGAVITKGQNFSGWTPNPDSPVLKEAQATYKEMFDKDAKINIIHAGLECGLLGEAYPNWDMISFGPTIKGAHSPDERVEIESVGSFWTYLVKMLEKIAN